MTALLACAYAAGSIVSMLSFQDGGILRIVAWKPPHWVATGIVGAIWPVFVILATRR